MGTRVFHGEVCSKVRGAQTEKGADTIAARWRCAVNDDQRRIEEEWVLGVMSSEKYEGASLWKALYV